MAERPEVPAAGAANDNAARVIGYDDMTPEQRRIVDAGERPGIPVPELSGGKLVAWFMRLTIRWTDMTEEERATLRFLETADDEAYRRWAAEMDAKRRPPTDP